MTIRIPGFDGGLPRASAEARVFACCVAEWLNRNPVRSPPGRCLGCGAGRHSFHLWNLYEDIAMSAKKPAANASKTVVADDPEDRKGRLKDLGGSQSDRWNNVLANQAMQALWVKNSRRASGTNMRAPRKKWS